MSKSDMVTCLVASALLSSAKTIFYAFTIPNSIRKIISKSDSFKSHKRFLLRTLEIEDERVSKAIDLGDLMGYANGLTAAGIYGIKTAEKFSQGNPDILDCAVIIEHASLGYEAGRFVKKIVRGQK